MRVEVDPGLCESNAVRVGLVLEVFDLGCDDKLHVLGSNVSTKLEPQLQESVRQYPCQAITLFEQESNHE